MATIEDFRKLDKRMRIIVVDENDKVIGYKERDDRNKTDIIRVSGLWIYNLNKEVLIAQRSRNKIHDPGKWGPSAAGTVEEGETYTSNILKETQEELGISIAEKDLSVGSCELSSTSHRYFGQRFFAKIDLPITSFSFQKEEVEAIRWISLTELSDWFKRNPEKFLASFERSVRDLQDFFA